MVGGFLDDGGHSIGAGGDDVASGRRGQKQLYHMRESGAGEGAASLTGCQLPRIKRPKATVFGCWGTDSKLWKKAQSRY